MIASTDQDSRPIYSDVGEFTRGRSGFRKDPTVDEAGSARWAFWAIITIIAVFVAAHLLLPNIA